MECRAARPGFGVARVYLDDRIQKLLRGLVFFFLHHGLRANHEQIQRVAFGDDESRLDPLLDLFCNLGIRRDFECGKQAV